MIGIDGNRARMACDTSIAVRNCGPPITLTPTASMCPVSNVRTAVETKSRSTLPSIMLVAYLSSRAAERLSTANGNRALRRLVIVGLIRRIWGGLFMTSCRRPSQVGKFQARLADGRGRERGHHSALEHLR